MALGVTMQTPTLVAIAGPLEGAAFPIDHKGLRIGRAMDAEVRLDTPDASRHHARVILHNGALWVQDSGSRNGIMVNGSRVAGHKQVSPGDTITVAGSAFRVELRAGDVLEPSLVSRLDTLISDETPPPPARAGRTSSWPLVAVGLTFAVVTTAVTYWMLR